VEPGAVPAQPVTLSWPTFSAAAEGETVAPHRA